MQDTTDNQPRAADEGPLAAALRLVIGYDGSPPAARALDAAAAMLRGRRGGIGVVWVAHIPGVDMMSAAALVRMEADLDEIEKELRASAAAQMDGRRVAWDFSRRDGAVVPELIAGAAAVGTANEGDLVSVVVGSSSHAAHRFLGSVAVGLARHCPVPLLIVP